MMSADVYRVLFEAFRKRDISALAQAAFEVLQMPVVVTDAAFIVRAKYPDKPLGDEQWDANVMNRQIEPRFIKTFTDDDHFARHDLAGRTILTDFGHYAKAPRLTTVIRVDDVVLGYFAALATGVEVERWHFDAADVIVEALAMFMDESFGAPSARSGLASPALYALLGDSGEGFDFSLLSETFIEENRPPYLLLSVRTEDPHNAPLEMYFGNELVKHFEHALQAVFDDSLYILACAVADDARGSVRAQLLTESLRRRGFRCGMSRPFNDLREIRDRRWEADASLTVGMRLGHDDTLFHYDDYLADIVCDVVGSAMPASALQDSALMGVKQHDRQNGTDYFETLKTYYLTRFDKKRTCELLHIHRNTLQYRLDRISQMEGIDLDSPFYALYMALEDYRQRLDQAGAPARSGERKAGGGA